MISFQVGSDDAETLALHLSQVPGQVRPADIANLPKYVAYARLLTSGMPSRPFSVRTLPPPAVSDDQNRSAIVRAASHRRYAAPADRVRREIGESLGFR